MRARIGARVLVAILAALLVLPATPPSPVRAVDPASITLSSPDEISPGAASVTYGNDFTIEATIDPDGPADPGVVDDGTVTFTRSSGDPVTVPVVDGKARHSWSLIGGTSIVATYQGGTAYSVPDPSAPYSLTVLPVPVTVGYTVSPASPEFAGPVAVDVTVDPATATTSGWARADVPFGGVRVYRVPPAGGDILIGEAPATAGEATVALALPAGVPVPAGTSQIRVEYLGGSVNPADGPSFLGFSSGAVDGSLTIAETPATVQIAGPGTLASGEAAGFTVTVGPAAAAYPPTGIVQLFDGEPTTGGVEIGASLLATGDAGSATIALASPLAAGAHDLYATFDGATAGNEDPNRLGGTSAAFPVAVGTAATSITLESSANPVTYGTSITLTAGVSPSAATGTVTFRDGATSLGTCTLAAGTCSLATGARTLGAGAHSLTADYGGDGSYAGSTSTTLSQTVSPKALTVTAITASNKAYDGLTTATISTAGATLNGVVAGDSVSLVTAGATGAFADKNVANGKTVTVSGLALAGADAGNYTITQPTTAANIAPRSMTVAATGIDKEYDGTTAAAVTLSSAQLVGGDVVEFTYTATFAPNEKVGTSKTVNVSGIVKSGADAGNYALANTTASTTADITPRVLVMSISAASKTYDGTTTAAATGSLDRVVAGDHVNAQVGAATFADKNAGTGKIVTATGLGIGGPDSSQYSLTNSTATATANITTRSLTVSAAGVNKTYDGTTAATVTVADNRIAGDVVTFSYSASFATPVVGTGKAVSVTAIAIAGGADAGNYALANTSTTATASITTASVTPSIVATDKIYDGTTAATASCSLAGILAPDVGNVTCSGTATFPDKNVGTGRTVTATAITIAGSASGNYALSSTSATDTADVTARSLVVTATGVDRVYDGTTTAAVTYATDKLGADVITVSAASATYADENVGTAKTVTVTGISIGGADAGNYALANTTTAATASITKRPLTVTASAQTKVYDRTTAATVTLGDNRIAGDDLAVSHGAATFADKNVGTGKVVTVPGIALSGADAGNYTAATTVTTIGSITARPLAVTAAASDKVYDGATTASVSLADDRLTGDVLAISAASATFANENVGAGKIVTVSGISISGIDAGNYAANTSTTTSASINPRPLLVTATASNKVYDGTTSASVTLADNRVSGDILTIGHDPATFSDRSAGTGKTVTVPGIVVGGADAGNYTANASTTTTASITRAPVAPIVAVADKVYDATTAATITGRSLTGVIGGDAVVLTGGTAAFPTKNVGAVTVVVNGLSLAGTDAGNYQLSAASASTTATITTRPITVTAVTSAKVYDGTTSSAGVPTITGGTLAGSETAAWTQAFDTKTVGSGKAIAPAGSVADGNGGANYAVTFVNATGSITAKPLTVTGITAASRVYNGTTAATLATGSATLVGRVIGDNVALVTAGAMGTFADKNVGTGKVVTVSGLALSGTDAPNYALTQPTTSATITKAALSVTAEPKSRPYGSPNPPLTVAYTGFVGGEILATSGVTGNPTCTTAAGVNDVIGPYPIDCTAGTLAATNYSLVVSGATLTITRAPLTLIAGNKSRQYGLPNPVLTATVTGFVNGETAGSANLAGAPSCSTTAVATDGVGTRPITCTAGTLAAPNYAVTTLVPGTLSITPALAAPTVTSSANPAAATEVVTLTASVAWPVGTPSGSVTFFEGAAGLSGPVTLDGGVAELEISYPEAGEHDIVAIYSGDGANFGQASSTPFRIVVGKSDVAVTVTADRATWETNVPITFTADLAPLASGVTVPVSGTVAFRVDGALRATVPVVAGKASYVTKLALGGHSVDAAFTPDTAGAAVFNPGASVALARNVVTNTVSASGVGVSSSSVYPVRDTWKDTVTVRGTRKEAASVSIKIYRVVKGPDPKVRSRSYARATGAYAYAWNGRSSSGRILPAGKYKVVQVLTDAFGAKRKYVSYVTLSTKKMTWYTKTITVSPGPRKFSVASDTSIQAQYSTTKTRSLTMAFTPPAGSPEAVAWRAVGYQFTLPKASTYASLSFRVQGSWTGTTAPKIGLVPWNGGDWGSMYSTTRPRAAMDSIATDWDSQTITNLAGTRSGRSVRAVIDSFTAPSGWSTGPFRYSITGVRLVVRYGILK